MKIKALLLGLAFFAVNTYAENWSGSPLTVKAVNVDMRFNSTGFPTGTNARILVKVKENSTVYFYYYDFGNSISLAKANQFLSTLLTAKSTGEGIFFLYFLNSENAACPLGLQAPYASQTCFDGIQIGPD